MLQKKWFPYLLVAALGILLLISNLVRRSGSPEKDITRKEKGSSINRDRGFDRRTSFIEYSQHALCRMDCRHINRSEVEDIMKNGHINYRKSDLQNARCPRYALEGRTADAQQVRIIFAQCNEKTEVVTVIDLDSEWECHCPGDDK
jgi:hypothetical protein